MEKNIKFLCPTCKSEQNFQKEEEILNLIKNFNLLRIVEKIESRKSVTNSQISVNTAQLNNKIQKEVKLNINPEKNNAISDQSEQNCKKHSFPLHFYVLGTNLLLCEVCVKETNIKAYPLPSVLN